MSQNGEEYSTTPKWDNFSIQMQHVLGHAKAETAAAEAKINGDHTETDLKVLKRLMDTLEAEFSQYMIQYRRITSEEYVEDDSNLYNELKGAMSCIVTLVVQIDTKLGPLPTPQPKVDNSGAATLAAFMKVANSPPVELPTFDGKKISEYAAFKEKFKFVIQYIAGPKELWATHLESKLIGEAKKYIGLKGSWYNKYEELWEALDDKYANRWNIATEAVRNFFFKTRPEDNQESVLNWFHEQIDNLRSVIDLNMSVEEIGTNLILQTLPDNYAREVRSGLRVAHAGNKKKAAFSIRELRTVVNDTIAINHEPESFSPPKSTLNLQTAVTSTGTGSTASTPQSHQPPSQPNGRGRGKTRGGRGRGRGRGKLNHSTRTWTCILCDGPHKPGHCTDIRFQTPEDKRQRLSKLGKCIACAWHDKHASHECQAKLCTDEDHKNLGQHHLQWLCGGKDFPGIKD